MDQIQLVSSSYLFFPNSSLSASASNSDASARSMTIEGTSASAWLKSKLEVIIGICDRTKPAADSVVNSISLPHSEGTILRLILRRTGTRNQKYTKRTGESPFHCAEFKGERRLTNILSKQFSPLARLYTDSFGSKESLGHYIFRPGRTLEVVMNIGRVVKGIDFTALADEKSQKVIEFLNTLEFGISTKSGTVTQYVSPVTPVS